jgi:tape measure domain-containing protein
MTSSIDKRIVGMEFENQQFEKGVSTTLSSIDKLKKSLHFPDSSKSFQGITDAANRVNLGSIADGVSNISSKFSALGIVAITTLVNMANSAYQAGARIVKALTIDPIRTGLTEYETKLNSIQTILANTQKEGTNLDTVTKALNDLNTYSDKTIYNFQQMARNIGTFTAAGVKLDDSVAAIKGIANLAAISGSNADQASTAMYQLSQALSTGTVRLMDWNSVVNAGMGGQVFQEAVMETARVHGVAIDQIIKEEGSFRDSLQRGWFSSEILTETLQKFAGDLNAEQLKTMGYTEDQIAGIIKMGQTANDAATKVKTFSQLFQTLSESAQSGWAQTWELILGDFEEAKKFFTEANNILGAMIGSSADARNAILQGWKDLGGRENLIDAVRNAFEGVLMVIKPITEALREIFPPITARNLQTLTLSLLTLSKRMQISGENADKLKRIFKGIFAIVDIFRMAIVAVGKALFGLSGDLAAPLDSLTDFLARIADGIVKFRDGVKATDAFGKAIENIKKFLEPIISTVKKFFESFSGGFDKFKGINFDGLTTFMDNLKIRFEPLSQLASLTGKFLGLIGNLLSKLAPVALKLGGVIADGVGSFIDRITLALENFEPERVFDIINGGLLAGVLLAIKKFVDKGSGMFDGVKDVLDGVRGSLAAWQASLKADVLLKIAGALAILTLSVIALSMIDSKKLTGALTAMTIMFTELGISLAAFQKVTSLVNPIQMGAMSLGLVAVASAMLILSGAVSMLGNMDTKSLIQGMVGITTLIGVAKLASATLSTSAPGLITGSVALIVFSVAMRALGRAVEKLGALDTGVMTQGLIGVGVIMTEIALFLKTTDVSGLGVIKSVGILILAGAMNLLAIAVAKMGEMDSDAILKGLSAMGVIFTELALFTTLTGGGATLILTAAGVGVISIAMLALTEVMERLGNLSWEEIAKGLVAMAGALTLIGAASYLISPTLIIQAAGLVVMAAGLVILADALGQMGDMSWEEIGRGLVAMAGSLLILTVALTAMSGTLVGSAALLVAAGALLALAPALKILGSMSWEEIGRSLLALAGAFVVLGLAGAVLTPVIPTLIGLGFAVGLIGVGLLAAGVGILAFSAGLAALAISGAAGGVALASIIASIVGLVPMLVKTLGRAILALIDVLVAGAPTLLEGIVTLLNILLDGLIEVLPKVITTVVVLVESLLTALEEKTPMFVKAGYNILIAFLNGVSANIGEITDIAIDIVTKFVNAVGDRLPDIVISGWNLIISWIDAMALSAEENVPRLMEAVRNLGLSIVKGVVSGLADGAVDAKNAVIELGGVIVQGFKDFLGIHSPSSVFMALAGDIVQGLINGITSYITKVKENAKHIATTLVEGVKGGLTGMKEAGRDLVIGLANGIKEHVGKAIDAAASLAREVLDKIRAVFDENSPSGETTESGKHLDEGLAIGIAKFAGVVLNSVKKLGDDTINAFSGVVSNISNAINSDLEFSPSITPVLDLTNIQNGSSQIEGLLGDKKLNVSLATVRASTVSASAKTGATDEGVVQQTSAVPTVTFIQHNNSPKALSRIEIYRQTKNQLSQAKDLVGA